MNEINNLQLDIPSLDKAFINFKMHNAISL